MLKKGILIFILVIGIVSPSILLSQYQFKANEFIKEDSMNLAIFELDFQSYEFNEANVTYYPLCDCCDYYNLPFSIEFVSPTDFGHINFKYIPENSTLFYATIVWMGQGEIYYPDQFLPANSFERTNNHIPLLENAQYYDRWLIPEYYSWTQYKQKADSAWLSIDSLLIINEFAEYPYRVAFYAYTPRVGAFDPSVAKWIVFLYKGNDYLTIGETIRKDNTTLEINPNPTSGTIHISNYQYLQNWPYEIINTENRIVLKGRILDETLSISELDNGIYIIRLWSEYVYITRKIVLAK